MVLLSPQGRDDISGEPLIQQDDDKPEALVARLRHYKDVAKPIIDLYKYVHPSLHFTFLKALCKLLALTILYTVLRNTE